MYNHTTTAPLTTTSFAILASLALTSSFYMHKGLAFPTGTETPSIVSVSSSESVKIVSVPVAPPAAIPAPAPLRTISKETLNTIINKNLIKVYNIAKEFGHPETMQAILLQESGGGVSNPVGNMESPIGKRSYGVMQVQIVAARSILSRYPTTYNRYFPNRVYDTISDEEIVALLISNHEANIRIASQHFALYLSLSSGDWNKAVAAYNMGIGNANKRETHDDYPYVKEIVLKLNTVVVPFNEVHRLTSNL